MPDFSFLLGNHTDPVRQLGQFMSLAQLSKEGRMTDAALAEKQRVAAAQEALNAALPGVMQSELIARRDPRGDSAEPGVCRCAVGVVRQAPQVGCRLRENSIRDRIGNFAGEFGDFSGEEPQTEGGEHAVAS